MQRSHGLSSGGDSGSASRRQRMSSIDPRYFRVPAVNEPTATILQLPFPSTSDPDPALASYYRSYDKRFRELLPDFFVPQGSLWEMPLWVSHLTALLDSAGVRSRFLDLSKAPFDAGACLESIISHTDEDDILLMSPLAQNFSLAQELCVRLRNTRRRTVIGGNMAPLAHGAGPHVVHRGQLDATFVRNLLRLVRRGHGESENPAVQGLSKRVISWAPSYRHLSDYSGTVPLLRLNASHGCLYKCSFCGDAWSSQLHLVSRDALSAEVDELTQRFPETKIIYIGDKTFGQSKTAVRNLLDVFSERPGFRFIAQTHVLQVQDWVIEAMQELGVVAVELGFESGDTELLRNMAKRNQGLEYYSERLEAIHAAGIKVILNVMGGLPNETEASHVCTTSWLRANADLVWLCNLYNFVPYPLTPIFRRLRPRITNWNFADWREDAPPVYTPFYLSAGRSWELFKDKVATVHGVIRTDRSAESQLA